MAMKINCSILAPDRTLYQGQVHFAVVQQFDGEAGFLSNHAPYVSELGVGEVRLRTGDVTEYLVVEGGFVEMNNNELILLVENAYRKEELSKEDLQKHLRELEGRECKTWDDRVTVQMESARLKARLKVAMR